MFKREFIHIERINKEMFKRQFKYKRSWFKLVGSMGLMSLSFIIPDASISFMLGLMLLSPISLKVNIKNKIQDLKLYSESKFIKWGLK